MDVLHSLLRILNLISKILSIDSHKKVSLLDVNISESIPTMTTTAAADAEQRIQITPQELRKSEDTSRWYTEDITIPPEAQALLEQYSGFAPDEVVPHVRDLVSAHH